MPQRDIVVIGTSAGGLEALRTLFSSLPENLDAAILVVMHRTESVSSILPEVLARSSRLPVVKPEDGEPIQAGRIYMAPAGMHMLVESSRIRLIRGPRENRHRPAIDPLFRSAAATFDGRVIGVILTGMLDDGTSGLMVVHAQNGVAIVQNPATAMFPSMPQNALNRVPDAKVANLEDLPRLLKDLVSKEASPRGHAPRPRAEALARKETRITDMDMAEIENPEKLGQPSEFSCPECGGVLWEVEQGELLRFRCRVGHAYTADHLQTSQRLAIETALWAALRALEESLSMYRRLSTRAKAADNEFTAQLYDERIHTTETNTRVLQEFLLNVNDHQEAELADAEESA